MKVCLVLAINYIQNKVDVAGMFFTSDLITGDVIQTKAIEVLNHYFNSVASALNSSVEDVSKDVILKVSTISNQNTTVYINELINIARLEKDPHISTLSGRFKEVLDQFFDGKIVEEKPDEK